MAGTPATNVPSSAALSQYATSNIDGGLTLSVAIGFSNVPEIPQGF